MRPQKVIKKTAKNNGVSEQHVREEMQKALDATWNTILYRYRISGY